MIRPDTRLRVYLCREPVDMRKQIDGKRSTNPTCCGLS